MFSYLLPLTLWLAIRLSLHYICLLLELPIANYISLSLHSLYILINLIYCLFYYICPPFTRYVLLESMFLVQVVTKSMIGYYMVDMFFMHKKYIKRNPVLLFHHILIIFFLWFGNQQLDKYYMLLLLSGLVEFGNLSTSVYSILSKYLEQSNLYIFRKLLIFTTCLCRFLVNVVLYLQPTQRNKYFRWCLNTFFCFNILFCASIIKKYKSK
jgi:hypothetical protein